MSIQPTIYITRGLPASGKTTWAKEKVAKSHGQCINVCKDDLRTMLHFNTSQRDLERLVCEMRDQIIQTAIGSNKSVIVSDTNLNPVHITQIKKKFEDKADIEIVDFDTPVHDCIARDLKRDKPVGKDVILDMYYKYMYTRTPIEQDTSLPRAVIVDMDGTLAIMGARSPFDWDKVDLDTPNRPIIDLVKILYAQGYKILVLSGRQNICYDKTKKWLDEHGLEGAYEKLLMRATDDSRPDSVVKEEILQQAVLPNYYVRYVIDDRLQVCKMWYKLGLTLLKVGNPDLDF